LLIERELIEENRNHTQMFIDLKLQKQKWKKRKSGLCRTTMV